MKKKLLGTSLLALTASFGSKYVKEAYDFGIKALYRDSFLNQENVFDGFKKIKIKNHKGLLLQGYLLEKENAKQTLLIAHSFQKSSQDMKPYIDFFESLFNQMNILLIDANAHGNSDGYIRGFGYRDVIDLMFWNSYLLQRYGQDHTIVMYGLEMGANMILNAAGMGKLKNVDAIISEGAFCQVHHFLSYLYTKNLKTVSTVSPMIRLAIKKEINQDIKQMNTLKLIENNTIPTLFIHSRYDKNVDFSQVLHLYNANVSKKELFPIKQNYLYEIQNLQDDYSKTIKGNIINMCYKGGENNVL